MGLRAALLPLMRTPAGASIIHHYSSNSHDCILICDQYVDVRKLTLYEKFTGLNFIVNDLFCCVDELVFKVCIMIVKQ